MIISLGLYITICGEDSVCDNECAYSITLLHEVYWRGIWKGVRAEVVSLSIRIIYKYIFGCGIINGL